MIELLFTLLLIQSQSRIITCTVIEQGKAIFCPTPTRNVTIELWNRNDEVYTEWLWQAANVDSKPYRSNLTEGQKVKARWVTRAEIDRLVAMAREGRAESNEPLNAILLSDGALMPIASCQVRAARQVIKWAALHPGEIVPNAIRTEPDDCQPWYQK